MATVSGLTAERMLEIEAASVVDGAVVGDNLILTRQDASTINAGNVRGPVGPTGLTGPQGTPGVTPAPTFLEKFDGPTLSGYSDKVAGSLANYTLSGGKLAATDATLSGDIVRTTPSLPKNTMHMAMVDLTTNWLIKFWIRYVDANNNILVQAYQNAGGSRIQIIKNVAGVNSVVLQPIITMGTAGKALVVASAIEDRVRCDVWENIVPPMPSSANSGLAQISDAALNGVGPYSHGFSLSESAASDNSQRMLWYLVTTSDEPDMFGWP